MKTVLVVDDDPAVGQLLKAKLEASKRYSVLAAVSGHEALRVVESQRPDLVVCDIDMPDMDGVELADTMAGGEATKKIPLIFLSSLVTPKDVTRGVSAGNWPMLSKQTPIPELIKQIDQTLGVA